MNRTVKLWSDSDEDEDFTNQVGEEQRTSTAFSSATTGKASQKESARKETRQQASSTQEDIGIDITRSSISSHGSSVVNESHQSSPDSSNNDSFIQSSDEDVNQNDPEEHIAAGNYNQAKDYELLRKTANVLSSIRHVLPLDSPSPPTVSSPHESRPSTSCQNRKHRGQFRKWLSTYYCLFRCNNFLHLLQMAKSSKLPAEFKKKWHVDNLVHSFLTPILPLLLGPGKKLDGPPLSKFDFTAPNITESSGTKALLHQAKTSLHDPLYWISEVTFSTMSSDQTSLPCFTANKASLLFVDNNRSMVVEGVFETSDKIRQKGSGPNNSDIKAILGRFEFSMEYLISCVEREMSLPQVTANSQGSNLPFSSTAIELDLLVFPRVCISAAAPKDKARQSCIASTSFLKQQATTDSPETSSKFGRTMNLNATVGLGDQLDTYAPPPEKSMPQLPELSCAASTPDSISSHLATGSKLPPRFLWIQDSYDMAGHLRRKSSGWRLGNLHSRTARVADIEHLGRSVGSVTSRTQDTGRRPTVVENSFESTAGVQRRIPTRPTSSRAFCRAQGIYGSLGRSFTTYASVSAVRQHLSSQRRSKRPVTAHPASKSRPNKPMRTSRMFLSPNDAKSRGALSTTVVKEGYRSPNPSDLSVLTHNDPSSHSICAVTHYHGAVGAVLETGTGSTPSSSGYQIVSRARLTSGFRLTASRENFPILRSNYSSRIQFDPAGKPFTVPERANKTRQGNIRNSFSPPSTTKPQSSPSSSSFRHSAAMQSNLSEVFSELFPQKLISRDLNARDISQPCYTRMLFTQHGFAL